MNAYAMDNFINLTGLKNAYNMTLVKHTSVGSTKVFPKGSNTECGWHPPAGWGQDITKGKNQGEGADLSVPLWTRFCGDRSILHDMVTSNTMVFSSALKATSHGETLRV